MVGVAPGRVLHEEIGLRDRPGFGVHLLAEEMDLRVRVDRGPEQIAVLAQPDGDVLLGDHQHAAGAAARVVDGADRLLGADLLLVTGEHEIHHQMHDISRREVLAGILVQRLVELPDQLLEDRAHRGVVDLVRVQVDVLEALEHLEQQPRLVELADRVVEVELLQHLAHVRAEAGDVVAQVRRQMRRVGEELVEVVAGGVVEREARDPAELRVEVLELLAPKLGLFRQHLLLRAGQHAVQAAQDGERQDDVLVLAALEGIADEVRDAPEEADDLAMVHCVRSPSLLVVAASSLGLSNVEPTCAARLYRAASSDRRERG